MFIGADPAELDSLAGVLSTCAGTLEGTRRHVNSLVNTTRWEGAEADHFRAIWPKQMRLIESAVAALNKAAAHVRFEAEQQRNASDAPRLPGAGISIGSIHNSTNAAEVAKLNAQVESQTAGMTPQQVILWWNGLSRKQQQEYLKYIPATLATLPGLGPAVKQYEGLPAKDLDTEVKVEGEADVKVFDVPVVFKIGADGEMDVVQNHNGTVDVTVTGKVDGEVGVGGKDGGLSGDAGVKGTGEVSRTYEFKNPQDAQAFVSKMLSGTAHDPLKLAENIANASQASGVKVISTVFSGQVGQTGSVKFGDNGSPVEMGGSVDANVGYSVDTTQHTQTWSYSVDGSAAGRAGLDGMNTSGELKIDVTAPSGDHPQVQTLEISGKFSDLKTTGNDAYNVGAGAGGTFYASIDLSDPKNVAAADALMQAIAHHDTAAENAALKTLYENATVYAQTQVITSTGSELDGQAGNFSGSESETATGTVDTSTYVKTPGQTQFVDFYE